MTLQWLARQCINLHPPRNKSHTSTSEQGFTLTEILVVVIIAGILAAIAAPGWLTFMNRQRVSTANKEVLQMLRDAQTQAIAKRTTYGILLKPNEPDGPAITQFTAKGQTQVDPATGLVNPDNFTELYTETLGEGSSGLTIEALPNNLNNQYRFRFDGSVDQASLAAGAQFDSATDEYVYKIVVSKEGTKRCVIVETLLGAMREGVDDGCDA